MPGVRVAHRRNEIEQLSFEYSGYRTVAKQCFSPFVHYTHSGKIWSAVFLANQIIPFGFEFIQLFIFGFYWRFLEVS